MHALLKRIRIWLGLPEMNWWDEIDCSPIPMIQGEALAAALNHRRACA